MVKGRKVASNGKMVSVTLTESFLVVITYLVKQAHWLAFTYMDQLPLYHHYHNNLLIIFVYLTDEKLHNQH